MNGVMDRIQVQGFRSLGPVSYTHLYGDVNTLKEGSAQFNNNNWFSGPYAMLYINDYEMVFDRNPGFMPDTEWAPNIKNLHIKMMSDMNTAYSALRSGEIDDCMPCLLYTSRCV